MTVGELIEHLKTLPASAPVYVDDWNEAWAEPKEIDAENVSLFMVSRRDRMVGCRQRTDIVAICPRPDGSIFRRHDRIPDVGQFLLIG